MAVLRWINDILHSQKDELSLNKHMGVIIYTKGNIILVSYEHNRADMGAKVE
jgi:hypothetical protein